MEKVKEVFVKFVGVDEVVEHIVSMKEKKLSTSTTKRKVSHSKPTQSNVEEVEVTFCDNNSDTKHSEAPNGLFASENEMAGSDVFTFRTPKKHNQLLKITTDLLSKETISTPRKSSKVEFDFITPVKTPKPSSSSSLVGTPRSILKKTPSMKLQKANLTTPSTTSTMTTKDVQFSTPRGRPTRNVPRKTPNRLWRRNNAEDSEDSLTSDEEEEEEEDEEEKFNKSSSKKRNDFVSKETKSVSKGTKPAPTPLKSRRKLELSFGVDEVQTPKSSKKKVVVEDFSEKTSAEPYFEFHHLSKSSTSDRTLSRLKVSNLEPSEMMESLSKVHFLYEDERASLYKKHSQLFDQLMFAVCQGFNILLHGLGSKMKLMEKFRKSHVCDFIHVVIHGFFPGLTIKSVMSCISEVISGNSSVPSTCVEQVNHIRTILSQRDFPHFFLIIHNIDGMSLRQEKVQQTLSLLGQIKNFHLVASVDHINSPLLWDITKSSRFNWLWFETTTYDGYVEETSYENSIMVKHSGSLALSSLSHVMKSLTPNAQGIFILVIKYKLENKNEVGYQGFAFPDLYQRSRESFFVNSEQTLRAQLVEFKDHKLIKTRTGLDGVEYVVITLDDSTLSTFLEQQEQQSQ